VNRVLNFKKILNVESLVISNLVIWYLSPLRQFITMGSDTEDEAILQNLIKSNK